MRPTEPQPTEPQGRVILPIASRSETVKTLAGIVRPHRLRGAVMLSVLLGRATLGLAGPLLLGSIVDLVVEGNPVNDMLRPFILLLVVAAGEGILAGLGTALIARFGEPVLATLRERVLDRALGVPLSDIERAGTGDLVSRVGDDVSAVSEAIRFALPALMGAALSICLTIVGLGVLDWRLALAGLCAAPIQLYTLRWFLPRSAPLYARERLIKGERAQQLFDSIDGASTVRAFRLSEPHTSMVRTRSRAVFDLVLQTVKLQSRFFGRLNLAEFVGLTAILIVGFMLVGDGVITIGAVTAAALYFQRLFDPINILLYLIDEAQSAGAALARLVGVANLPGPPVSAPQDEGPAITSGLSIRIQGLGFAYQVGPPVLHNIDLEIAPGERVALVGVSGAGKTTLAKLIAGIHEPSGGEIRIGEAGMAELGSDGIRRLVCLVTQEIHVFSGSLSEDLRLAKPDASDGELERALELVGAVNWAAAMPDGIATVVGEGGFRLTPTQVQQVALARLALRDPPVAILDEATAEAGSSGARMLEAAASRILKGRTSLVVAHRLTQAASADRVVVMEEGRIVEVGTHAGLVKAGGAYSALWKAWSFSRS